VGDPVVSNVTKVLAGSRGYPVQVCLYIFKIFQINTDSPSQYPASSAIISGTIQGAVDVVQRVVSQSLKCPRQTFALVGYSQGAGVMHRAADDLPRSLYPKIKALVMFGDPSVRTGTRFPAELQAKLLQNCAKGDPVSRILDFKHGEILTPSQLAGL
jgi:pimeloyl-ACP methyl ester carboxylesterase